MNRPPASPPPRGAPTAPAPSGPELRDPPDGSVAGKDEPGTGTSPDPRAPYGPDQGPPVGEAAGEDSETKPPAP